MCGKPFRKMTRINEEAIIGCRFILTNYERKPGAEESK